MNAEQSQTDQVIDHLKQHGEITPMEALAEYAIMRLAARVLDARKRGMEIATEIVTERNRYGQAVRFAKYRMVA